VGVLGKVAEMFGWGIRAYVLMRNHFHLAMGTDQKGAGC
jgi:REP element-mobilizing transposase RayT